MRNNKTIIENKKIFSQNENNTLPLTCTWISSHSFYIGNLLHTHNEEITIAQSKTFVSFEMNFYWNDLLHSSFLLNFLFNSLKYFIQSYDYNSHRRNIPWNRIFTYNKKKNYLFMHRIRVPNIKSPADQNKILLRFC